MTKLGSREHFQQVLDAHIVTFGTYCRCGARVANYREHIANVWLPWQLPVGWQSGRGSEMRLDGETVGWTVKRTYATRNEAILREPEDFWPLVQRCAL